MGIWSRLITNRHNIVPLTGPVGRNLTLNYGIRETVSNDLTLQYGLRELIANDLQFLYELRNTIANDLTVRYNMNGVVANTLQLIWAFIAPTAAANKPAIHSGVKLPTIQEDDNLPERHAKVTTVAIAMQAKLTAPEIVPIQETARLFAGQEVPIGIESESVAVIQRLMEVRANFRAPIENAVHMEATLKSKQKGPRTEAKLSLFPVLRQIHKNLEILLGGKYQTFEIKAEEWQTINAEEILHFKDPSVVVGLVTYDTETGGLSIFLGGDNRYDYCNVPARIFDSFRGADSKGAYYNRNIKGQYLC